MPDILRTCRITGKEFLVTEFEQELLKKIDPEMPLPTLCIDERHRRRLAHRNERNIYKGICSKTGKSIVTIFSPDKNLKILSADAWWSDDFDGKDFGRDFDFSRSFFEQFSELQRDVPHLALLNTKADNSDYCNNTVGNKNCYLVFGGDLNQDSMYSLFCMGCRDVMDVYWVNKSELVYDCVDSSDLYNAKYCRRSVNCWDSQFLFECRNCEYCFGCVGLVGKQYYIFNKPFSKDSYFEEIKKYRLDTWTGVEHMKKEFEKFQLQFPHRFADIINSENCSGDDITNSKNCINCFGAYGPAEDLQDVFFGGMNMRDGMSSDHIGYQSELLYEMMGSVNAVQSAFSPYAWYSQEVFYCDTVTNSKNLFGCSNLKRSEYCILNKQYSKEEYFDLRGRIVEHMKKTAEWGEFFPMERSLFCYNETVAQDYFPLSREETLKWGLRWHDEEKRAIPPKSLVSDSISDVQDSICGETLICEKIGRPYKIIPQELSFYRKMGVPIPHYAPETRHRLRLDLRNPLRTWTRQCAKCGKSVESSYAPQRKEIIYCGECYLETVY